MSALRLSSCRGGALLLAMACALILGLVGASLVQVALNRTVAETSGREDARMKSVSGSAIAEVTYCLVLAQPAAGAAMCAAGWSSWTTATGGLSTRKDFPFEGGFSYRATVIAKTAGGLSVSVEAL